MFSIKSCAVSGAVTVVVVGTKCACLLRRSTKTRIASLPFLVFGRAVIKSIPIWSQFLVGIGRGCKVPDGAIGGVLYLWQVSQDETNQRISAVIFGQ